MKRLLLLLPAFLAFQVSASPALAWTWPADGPVLRYFQFGDDPYASGQHRGIDIQAHDGSDVLAPASGLVTFGGTVPSGGKTLTIETASGYAVTLLHLGVVSTRKGESVVEGSVVGTAGRSGTPEHDAVYVHLGVRLASDRHGYVDPLSFLPARTGEDPPLSVTQQPAEASRTSAAGDNEAEHEGATVSFSSEGTAPAEPVSVETLSVSTSEAADTASPSVSVPTGVSGISTTASLESESESPVSEAVQEALRERANSQDANELPGADLPDAPRADSALESFIDPASLIATASPEATARGASEEASSLATEVLSIDVSKSPEPVKEPRLAASESQATGVLEDTTTEARVSVNPANSSEVPVLVNATESQGGSVNPASEADSPVTDGLDVGVQNGVAEEKGAAPSSSSLERLQATTPVNGQSDVGEEDRRRLGRAQSTASPADSSASTSRGTKPASHLDRPEDLKHVATPVAPTIQTVDPTPSASRWLGILDDVEHVHAVDPIPPRRSSENVEPPSRSGVAVHDRAEVAQRARSLRQALPLLIVGLALALALSCAAVAIRYRRHVGSARTSRPSGPQPGPVALAQRSEPGLPELSESDRMALDAELDQILVSPRPAERSDRRSGMTLPV